MMAGFGLRKNMAFEWNGTAFRIDRLQPNGDVLLERIEDGHLDIVTREMILAEYRQGKVFVKAVASTSTSKAAPTFSRPLDELPERVRNETVRRRHYLESIHAHGTPVFTVEYMKPLIRQAAAEIGDGAPPSVTTIYRWCRRFLANSDTRALIPRIDLRGSKHLRQSERVLQLASEAIEEAFKASPQATGSNIYTRLLAKIDAENRRMLLNERIKPPAIRTLYRLLARADVYETIRLREGKAAADKRFMVGKVGVRTNRVLERVEIDHTPLDLFLIDERTWLPLGRPTLTVVIDHFSRMLLGYHLSFDSPSTGAVMAALRHAILPKSPANDAIPGLTIEHSWPCYGRPEVMVVDNGLEFHGADLESVAYDLGIRIQYCPKHQPRFKGVVERYLKTINYFFAHQLPGTSFARFHQRGDYDPQKCAVLTFAEFKHLFEKWVVDVYFQTIHRGLGATPWCRWHESTALYEPELPDDLRTFQQRIGRVTERSLRRDGVQLHGIRYNSDALGPILRAFGVGVLVRVLYDPEDLGEIQIWGPNDADPVSVLALDQGFAHGLTLKQNEFIREELREKGAAGEDRVALERARYELSRSVEALMTSRKQIARRRSAALRGISSSRPNGSAPPVIKQPNPTRAPKPTAIARKEQKGNVELPPVLPTFQLKRKHGGKP